MPPSDSALRITAPLGCYELALVAMKDGLAVRRQEWRPDVSLRLVDHLKFVLTDRGPHPFNEYYVFSTDDLLASDWEAIVDAAVVVPTPQTSAA